MKKKPVAKAHKPKPGINVKRLREHCRSLSGATEDLKWGADLMWSVGGKIFAGFCGGDDGIAKLPLGFKCSDEDFERLTEKKGIIPAPYAARFGWVSICEPGALTQKEAEQLISESYRLVKEKLPRRVRESIGK